MKYKMYIPQERLASEFPAEFLRWRLEREKNYGLSHKNMVDYLEFSTSPKDLSSLRNLPIKQREKLYNEDNDLLAAYSILKNAFYEKYGLELELMNDDCVALSIRYIPESHVPVSYSEFLDLEKKLNHQYNYNNGYLWLAKFHEEKVADKYDFIILKIV